ncbi:uroporphyrinogen-III synthase [Thermolongibacillus altinsuensis]|nr:uroporphyrinogen-III synthase [Thermolongibacillus altinsuensis]
MSLRGKKVLVTREREQAKSFSAKLKEQGALPVEVPLIQTSLPQQIDETVLAHWNEYDWIVFTSQNGVKYFFELAGSLPEEKRPKVAAVGEKTAQALQKKWGPIDLVPDEFVAESLAEAMKQHVQKGERILLVKGNLARETLRNELQSFAQVTDFIVYETSINKAAKEELIRLLEKKELDVITFTSSSTVRNFMELLDGCPLDQWLKDVAIACIGPITKQTAHELGMRVDICPHTYTIDGMIEAMNDYFK